MGSKGPNTSAEQTIATEQAGTAAGANARSQQLFDMGMPGLQSATDYYTKLSKGDPTTMMTAEAPAMQQIAAHGQQAKEAITKEAPRGGAQDLAKAEVDAQTAGQQGNLLTQAYTSSFPALAQIGQGGVGLSINQMAEALSGFSGASNTQSNVSNQEAAGKAASMSMFGSLIGSGAELATGL